MATADLKLQNSTASQSTIYNPAISMRGLTPTHRLAAFPSFNRPVYVDKTPGRDYGFGGSDSSQQASAFLHKEIGLRFGSRLRDLRRSHGLTQLDMAVAFGIDRSYISDVECGKKGISLATLEVIALGFGIKLSELLHDI